jgi:hypothetical protein
LLHGLLAADQKNPDINYQIPWCNDILENEREAIAYYRAALDNGLNDHDASLELLLTTLVNTTSDDFILHYTRAILFYSDKINQTWPGT